MRSRRNKHHDSGDRLPHALIASVLVLSLAVAGCDSQADEPPASTPSPSTSAPATTATGLTFGVYGKPEEIDSYSLVVDSFNASSTDSQVKVVASPDHDTAMQAIRDGSVPDVFLADQEDLAYLQEEDLIEPLYQLLDERDVDFGDGYSRDALQAFSADNDLQCMPYGVSPMVIYFNADLVDFERMRQRELEAPDNYSRWSFTEFAAAADFATKPRLKSRGVHIDPTLRGLAPFIQSGGGNVFNDDLEPTSLAFSDDSTKAALDTTLQLLRSPLVTLSEAQLAKHTPLEWFKRGRLGMIAGHRDLVPELRRVQALNFDVIAMPTLEQSVTVGDFTALCLSAEAAETPAAADFLVHAIDVESMAQVTEAGHLVPANLAVAQSEVFLQPGRQPVNAEVFNSSVRDIVQPPVLDVWDELEAAVGPGLDRLLSVPVLDIDQLTEEIDTASQTVLDPETAAEESGSEEGSEEQ